MDKRITMPKRQRQGIGRSGYEENIHIHNNNDMDVDVTLFDDDPPNVTHPHGKKITWLAHFKVHGQVKYTIHVNGIGNFVFWDGNQLQISQNWTTLEMTGDPAIGKD